MPQRPILAAVNMDDYLFLQIKQAVQGYTWIRTDLHHALRDQRLPLSRYIFIHSRNTHVHQLRTIYQIVTQTPNAYFILSSTQVQYTMAFCAMLPRVLDYLLLPKELHQLAQRIRRHDQRATCA